MPLNDRAAGRWFHIRTMFTTTAQTIEHATRPGSTSAKAEATMAASHAICTAREFRWS
jgi:hypothetical protein